MKSVSTKFTVKEFSKETWADFETLFGKHKGVRGGCWCTFHLCTSAQYDKMAKDERKEFQKELAYQGLGSGILVYDQETPVAWCQVGLAERFPRYERMRAYQELNLPAQLLPRWRISCLFVDKHRRHEGLSTFALHAAVEFVRQHGGGVVEAFPLDILGARALQYTGSERMYKKEGFETVARLGKSTLLMRLVI
jgi:GNAT superfamily N-acetyltransferase